MNLQKKNVFTLLLLYFLNIIHNKEEIKTIHNNEKKKKK
jgi:hypothetical protein